MNMYMHETLSLSLSQEKGKNLAFFILLPLVRLNLLNLADQTSIDRRPIILLCCVVQMNAEPARVASAGTPGGGRVWRRR